TGDPLHAQARQLAQHRGDRIQPAQPPVLGPSAGQPGRTSKNFAGKSRRGSGNAIAGTARWIGSSPPKTPASSCGGSIRQLRIDGVLASVDGLVWLSPLLHVQGFGVKIKTGGHVGIVYDGAGFERRG